MNTEKTYTPEQQEELVRIIAKGGFVSFEMEQYQVWQDLMNLEERELTLMMAGFTGLTNEELETFGSIYIPVGKEEILSILVEALSNELQGYGMDDSTMFTIGYKDGNIVNYSHIDCDFTPKRPLTNNQSGSTQDKIIRSSLNIRDIAFLIMTDGYEEPIYFATKDGMAALKRFGGFEEWHNGRGEHQRDYIQDDWI